MNKVQFDVGIEILWRVRCPSHTRQNLVVLYGCNKGPKMGTLSNPRHQTLWVYAKPILLYNNRRQILGYMFYVAN